MERLDVTTEELEALLEGVREALGEVGYQKLKAAIRTLAYVTELLENREATLEQLRRLLCHASTEKTQDVLARAGMRNLLYNTLVVSTSKLRHQINQSDQVLVAKEAAAGGRRHERIFHRHRGPSRWNRVPPPLSILKVDPVFAPVVAVSDQPERPAPQRMVGMGDLEVSIGNVAMVTVRCS